MAEQQDANLARIIAKINKLQNMTVANGATEPEERLSQAQAAKLMAQYVIDAAMLAAAEGGSRQEDITHRVFPIADGPYLVARSYLVQMLGIGLGGQAMVASRRMGRRVLSHTVTVVATTSVLDLMEALHPQLALHAADAVAGAWREFDAVALWETTGQRAGARRRFTASFLLAYAVRLKERLEASRRLIEDDTPGAALVLLSDADRIAARFDEMYPDLKKADRMKISSRAGMDAGQHAANGANIGVSNLAGGRAELPAANDHDQEHAGH